MVDKDRFLKEFCENFTTTWLNGIGATFEILSRWMHHEVTFQEMKEYEDDILGIVNQNNINYIKQFVCDGKLYASIICEKQLSSRSFDSYVQALVDAGKQVMSTNEYYNKGFYKYHPEGKMIYVADKGSYTVRSVWDISIMADKVEYYDRPAYWRGKLNFLLRIKNRFPTKNAHVFLEQLQIDEHTGEFYSIASSQLFFSLPYVNRKTYEYRLSLYEKLYSLLSAAYPEEQIKMNHLRNYIGLLKEPLHAYGSANVLEIVEALLKKGTRDITIHDTLYPIEPLGEQIASIFTMGSIRLILNEVRSPHALGRFFSQVNSEMKVLEYHMKTMTKKKRIEVMATMRKQVTLDLRRHTKGTMTDIIQHGYLSTFLLQRNKSFAKYNLSGEMVNDFMERISRYTSYATLDNLFSVFGMNLLTQFVNGTRKGFFKEHQFASSNELGEVVKEVLTTHPSKKKLFKQLRNIQDPKDMIRFGVKAENVEAVVKVLKNFRIASPLMEDAMAERHITAKIERKGSPEYLIAGDATDCCMRLFSEKAIYYAKEEEFGIFNLYYKDRIVGNSLIWMDDNHALVLDNIEIHPNYVKYNRFFQKKYEELYAFCKKEYGAKFLLQGETYNDLELYKERPKITVDVHFPKSLQERVKRAEDRIYSDAVEESYVIHAEEENPYFVISGYGFVDDIYFTDEGRGGSRRDAILQFDETVYMNTPVPVTEEITTPAFQNGIPDEESVAGILDELEPWRVRGTVNHEI